MITLEKDFQQKAQSRDHRKRSILTTALKNNSYQNIIDEFEFSLMGVTMKLCFAQPLTPLGKEFLMKKLGPFQAKQTSSRIDIQVYYKNAPGDSASMDSDLWANPDPVYWVFKNADGWETVQRDYAAKCNEAMNTFFVIGPEMHPHASDTIDNLIAFSFPRFLLKKNAIFLHSSCIIKDDMAYVFYGESGAGKSTVANFCGHELGHKVIGTDQTTLQWENGKLFAQACTRKSPEFPTGDPLFSFKRYEVAGLLNLVNRGDYFFKKLDGKEVIQRLITESYFYQPMFLQMQKYLNVCSKIVHSKNILLAEVSYPKGEPIWKAWE